MNSELSLVIEKKVGKKWVLEGKVTNDEKWIFTFLSSELVAKKINNCTYIKSIKREQHYTHVTITITYNNGLRNVYTIPSSYHF